VPHEGAKPTLAITKILHLHEGFCVRFEDARLAVLREDAGHDVSVLVLIPSPVADDLGSARWLPGHLRRDNRGSDRLNISLKEAMKQSPGDPHRANFAFAARSASGRPYLPPVPIAPTASGPSFRKWRCSSAQIRCASADRFHRISAQPGNHLRGEARARRRRQRQRGGRDDVGNLGFHHRRPPPKALRNFAVLRRARARRRREKLPCRDNTRVCSADFMPASERVTAIAILNRQRHLSPGDTFSQSLRMWFSVHSGSSLKSTLWRQPSAPRGT
jgi:hypothetical protein